MFLQPLNHFTWTMHVQSVCLTRLFLKSIHKLRYNLLSLLYLLIWQLNIMTKFWNQLASLIFLLLIVYRSQQNFLLDTIWTWTDILNLVSNKLWFLLWFQHTVYEISVMSDPLVSKTLGAFPLPFILSFCTSISLLLFPHFSTFHMPVVLQCILVASTVMQGESSAFYYLKNRKELYLMMDVC